MSTTNKFIYPNFKPLHISDRAEIIDYMRAQGNYSDFNFTNMFVWSNDNEAGISWLNGNLVLRLKDYLTGKIIYCMCGTKEVDSTLRELLRDHGTLYLVPEIVKLHSKDNKILFHEDRASFDYVYNTKKVVELAGNKYKKKRNKITKASKVFGDRITVANTFTLDETLKKEVMEVFDLWAFEFDKTIAQTAQERTAFMRLLEFSDELGCMFTMIRLDNKIIAFSVNEPLTKTYALCHFEKALNVQGNILSFIAHLVAKELDKLGFQTLNWEQDLGLPGLHRSKMSFYPEEFLKKYTVSLDDES